MSYSWIGAPTPFNGTNAALGGDSSKLITAFVDVVVLGIILPSAEVLPSRVAQNEISNH